MAAGAADGLAFTVLSSERAVLGESPSWCARDSCLWWVDIDGRRLLRTCYPAGNTDSWATPELPGFVVLTEDGPPAVGMETGIFLFDPEPARFTRRVACASAGCRFNDAAVDESGALWAATMAFAEPAPVGTVYRIGSDGRLAAVADGLITPNGLAVDGGRGRLYLSDSHPSVQSIWTFACDVETGALGERSLFATMEGMAGRPDGAALDGEGNYWIAGVGGGVVHVFAPGGDHLREIGTPFTAPTKVAFGGGDDACVFLTSKGGAAPNGAVAVARLDGTGFSGRGQARWRIVV